MASHNFLTLFNDSLQILSNDSLIFAISCRIMSRYVQSRCAIHYNRKNLGITPSFSRHFLRTTMKNCGLQFIKKERADIMNQLHYTLGIDIGSTTVKIAILNDAHQILFSDYERHYANIRETLAGLLQKAYDKLGSIELHPVITGSGGLTLANHLKVPFVQEVIAVASTLQEFAPQTDVAIELGGEDAKIIYFEDGNVEQRMNGICAGGTGSFIDQMASLLQTDASGLNEYAKSYQSLYTIAARCGVFAKSDIQPLINEGATKEDLSASIFQAVVNQTISGLACGKPIRGHVAFLGGPLYFLSELKEAFIRTLKLDEEHIIKTEHSHLFAAIGSALNAKEDVSYTMEEMVGKLASDSQTFLRNQNGIRGGKNGTSVFR